MHVDVRINGSNFGTQLQKYVILCLLFFRMLT